MSMFYFKRLTVLWFHYKQALGVNPDSVGLCVHFACSSCVSFDFLQVLSIFKSDLESKSEESSLSFLCPM